MANRIKEIKDNYIVIDRLWEKLYCDYSGHTEDCRITRGGERPYDHTCCNCGWDKLTDDMREAMQTLSNSIK
jgi:hypothetical protein